MSMYNVKSWYEKEQEIDSLGEIAGVSFNPVDAESLFIGVRDSPCSSLLEMKTPHVYDCWNSAHRRFFFFEVLKMNNKNSPMTNCYTAYINM